MPITQTDDEQPGAEKSAQKSLLKRVRERYGAMSQADHLNRRDALEDMRFMSVPGAQWDDVIRRERGERPCYEFNKLRVTAKRIVNDMRANRPSGKVRGVEGGDKSTAEVYEGLIRNIWNTSDGDSVIDYAAEYQVSGGMGAWRITTRYATDSAFEQDVVIEPIQNPFCLYSDPAAKDPLKRDAADWILTERISKASFKARWPDSKNADFESSEFDDDENWQDDETVRICEYWYKEPVKRELLQLVDGKVIDAESEEARIIPPEAVRRRRSVRAQKIRMCIASGEAILEEADWAGSQFPFVVVYGEHIAIDGRDRWFGIARFAKDAQRSYNIARTSIAETIALTPQAKWWATPEQALGHVDEWSEAHRKNYPFLLFNPDARNPGPPQRMGGADVPVALIQESQIASEEIKAVTGIYDASLGARSNETTGIAIRARQAQGEIATFNYQDNLSKGVRRTWELLVDLIPHIYDTEREMRVLGSDGSEDYVRVNSLVLDPATGQAVKVHDLSTGRYDVTVTAGPSFTTRRQEASETYLQLSQANPAVFGVAGDLIFRAMDLPYSEDIADRLRAMLPPPIQQLIAKDKAIPPEAQAAMAQAQAAMQMVEQQMQQVQMAAQAAQEEQAGIEKSKAEIDKAVADLVVRRAQFDAQVAKQLASITQKEAALAVHEADTSLRAGVDANASERASLAESLNHAVAGIQATAQEFMQEAIQTLAQIQARAEMQPQPKPRVVRVDAVRQGGKLMAVPVYEDLVSQQIQ